MKCPTCNTDLTNAKRSGVDVELCPTCQGMWLSRQELEQLEDEVFDFGENEKGSLAFDPTASTRKCPQCSTLMQNFDYRFYDLSMELCPEGHGFWLDKDEDKRVLEFMKKEEAGLQRKVLAEDNWASRMNRMRSGSFLDKLRNLLG